MQALGVARLINPVSLKARCLLPTRAVGVRSSRSMTGPTNRKPSLLFRQLFEKESSTYTYLLADVAHPDRPAVTAERDAALVEQLGLKLLYVMNTHVHADHITGTAILKNKIPGVQSATSRASEAKADVQLDPGERITFGTLYLEGGDASQLYMSMHSQIFTLPKDTLVYPAHDYRGYTVSTVAEELQHNPRLSKDEEEFKHIMHKLNLPYPKMIDVAVPSNMVCGIQDPVAISTVLRTLRN